MLDRVIELIRRELQLSEYVPITIETKYGDIEEWDSFGHITILAAIEKEFGIKLEFDDMAGIESVGDICDVIESK